MSDNSLLIGVVSVVCLVIGTLVFFKFSKTPKVLPQSEYKSYPLIRKEVLSHDTRRFTFGLPKGYVLGLPTGQHISLCFKDTDGKLVQRSYTPVSDNSTVGEVSLVIKVYMKGVHPKFPDGGKMSQHLDSLKIGDTIDMKGPKGHMEYKSGGKFSVKPLGKPLESRQTNQIIMIAGGTGITPMLQILHYIFANPCDPGIKVKLLYANQSKCRHRRRRSFKIPMPTLCSSSSSCPGLFFVCNFLEQMNKPRMTFWSEQNWKAWQVNFPIDFLFIIHWIDHHHQDGNFRRDLLARK